MVPDLSSRYNIRSIPTFIFFHDGKKIDLIQGASGQALQQSIGAAVNRSKRENVLLKKETLIDFYKEVDEETTLDKIETVYQKCADMNKKHNPNTECVGSAAQKLSKGLKQKYNKRVETTVRFTDEDRRPTDAKKEEETKAQSSPTKSSSGRGGGASDKPNLHLATKEQLMEELEKRLEAEEEARAEQMEDEDEDDEFTHSYVPSDFPERVTIIGGGPAGMSAAIYAARSGLKPVGE